MHAHSDADAYMQIAHTRVARNFLDAYLCTALYIVKLAVLYTFYVINYSLKSCNFCEHHTASICL